MHRGFTLIETLIYLALFAIVLFGIVATAYAYFETAGRNQTKAMIQEEAQFILGKVAYAMSGAKTVALTATSLTVTKYDGTIVTVALAGTNVTYAGAILNNTNTNITSLSFTAVSPGGVATAFTIGAPTPQGGTVVESVSQTTFIRP
jgi:Tfp pilus assembly protein PilE